MTENKLLYQQICDQENDVPLFLQYNWFNKIYDSENWNVAVVEKGGNVIGFLPYIVTRKKGFSLITPQFLSPYQGVWLIYPTQQKYTNKLSFEKEVITQLIEQLPKVDAFKQNFLPTFTNWAPFFWKGFKQTTRYTYIINNISEQKRVFADFKENIRREIRKAEKFVTIEVLNDIDLLYHMKQNVYQENKDTYVISLAKLKAIYSYCKTNNCGEMLMAKDNEGNINAILFYVWDNISAYYIHGVTANKYKTTGAMSLLLWEAIKRSSKRTKSFNFEGSMVEPIERYFRAFGGIQTPYFQISKTNSRVLKLLNY